MAYDLNGAWETSLTNFNAPLYATEQDTALKGYPVSVSWAVDYWLERGASANKLVLGMGTYGRGWKGTAQIFNEIFRNTCSYLGII